MAFWWPTTGPGWWMPTPPPARLLAPAVLEIGADVTGLLSRWPEVEPGLHLTTETQFELVLDQAARTYVDLRISPIVNNKGRLTGHILVFRDISRRKAVEAALQEANEELRFHVRKVESLHGQLRERAERDALTGLFNRRYLDECLPAEFAEAGEPGQPVGVVVMDLDQFKSFNDQLGHDAGDVMLRAAGHLLQANIRGGDTACRYGGEEFVVVLPGAPLEVTRRRADQWRQALEKLRVPYGDRELVCTLSAGVAAFPTHGATPADVLKAADQALYAAKAAGRNRVVVAGEASSPDAQPALPVDGA